MPELDTIRGIAVLLVLFFHGFGLHYGLQGLSGFSKVFVADHPQAARGDFAC
jgi:peptidoglycan/LPS O-acetylase OafA/YrhL